MFGRNWTRKRNAARQLEMLRTTYSLDQLRLRFGSEVFERVEPAYAALEAVPQMWTGTSQGRSVSIVSVEWEFARAARKSLLEHSGACADYVHTGTSSLLEGKSLQDALAATAQRGTYIASAARSARMELRMNAIRLEHNAVFGARPKPDDSHVDPGWFAKRMISSDELWVASRRGEYPHKFDETRQLVRDAINTAEESDFTQWNRQMKRVWDDVPKLRDAVGALEAFWDELVERTPRILDDLESQISRR